MASPPSIPSLEIERYGIPKFDITDDSTKEEPDPNQGNLFKNEEKPEPDESSDKGDSTKPEEDKKDNPDTGLFLIKMMRMNNLHYHIKKITRQQRSPDPFYQSGLIIGEQARLVFPPLAPIY